MFKALPWLHPKLKRAHQKCATRGELSLYNKVCHEFFNDFYCHRSGESTYMSVIIVSRTMGHVDGCADWPTKATVGCQSAASG